MKPYHKPLSTTTNFHSKTISIADCPVSSGRSGSLRGEVDGGAQPSKNLEGRGIGFGGRVVPFFERLRPQVLGVIRLVGPGAGFSSLASRGTGWG